MRLQGWDVSVTAGLQADTCCCEHQQRTRDYWAVPVMKLWLVGRQYRVIPCLL